MNPNIARISVQRAFCNQCAVTIKSELKKIIDDCHLMIYHLDALIVFNYHRAHQVSDVLNTLCALGYPPQGDQTEIRSVCNPNTCTCVPPCIQ